MWTNHSWMGGGMWIFPVIMAAIAVILIIFFGKNRYNLPWEKQNEQRETPLDILKKRFAAGEISKEEFDAIKQDLLLK